MKMQVEFPEIKKCCCFFPLRPGILVIGYIKLVYILLTLVMALENAVNTNYYSGANIFWKGIQFTFILVQLLDASFTVAFLIGGHQKCAGVLRVFFIYNIISTGLNSLLSMAFMISVRISLKYFSSRSGPGTFSMIMSFIATAVTPLVGLIALEIYFLVLIRSEIIKLKQTYAVENGTANDKEEEKKEEHQANNADCEMNDFNNETLNENSEDDQEIKTV